MHTCSHTYPWARTMEKAFHILMGTLFSHVAWEMKHSGAFAAVLMKMLAIVLDRSQHCDPGKMKCWWRKLLHALIFQTDFLNMLTKADLNVLMARLGLITKLYEKQKWTDVTAKLHCNHWNILRVRKLIIIRLLHMVVY